VIAPQSQATDTRLEHTIIACVYIHGHAVVAACTWNFGKVAAVHLHMKRLPINDPAYWRERAQEARRIAEQLADAIAKQTMLEIARSYDNLAEIAKSQAVSE
jgi:hypothetical protein